MGKKPLSWGRLIQVTKEIEKVKAAIKGSAGEVATSAQPSGESPSGCTC